MTTLLDSYSPERSAIGDEILKAAERLTSVATLRNPVAQTLRNVVAHLALGLPRFTRGVAETMSEVDIRYADSPLNGAYAAGPKPGERIAPTAGELPIGAGGLPRFACCATATLDANSLLAAYPTLVDSKLYPPLAADTFALVRPDGYLACSAKRVCDLAAYLNMLMPVECTVN